MNLDQAINHIRLSIGREPLTNVEARLGREDIPCRDVCIFYDTPVRSLYTGIVLPEAVAVSEFDAEALVEFIAQSVNGDVAAKRH